MFNLIAEIIEDLLNKNLTRLLEDFSCISEAKKDDYLSQIYKILDRDPEYRYTKDEIENEFYVERIRAFYKDCVTKENYSNVLLLLEILDIMLSTLCNNYKQFDDDYCELNKLNDSKGNIELYPRFNCSWKHENMYKCFRYHLNDHLKNLSYINKKAFPCGFTTKHYVVNANMFLIAQSRGTLNIGVSSITDKDVLGGNVQYSIENGMNCFSIKGLNYEDIVKTNCCSALQEAQNQNVDILMFPEILGTEDVVDELVKQINIPTNKTPPVVIFPSIWENNSNYSYIYFSNSGHITQYKNFKYLFSHDGDNYQENLKFYDNVINLIHCENIGTMVVTICKDLLIREHLCFLIEELGVNLIMSPSFSTGEYPFYITLPQGYQSDCNIVWINSCAAQHLREKKEDFPDIIALVSENGKIKKYSRNEFCKNNCKIPCLFVYEMRISRKEIY